MSSPGDASDQLIKADKRIAELEAELAEWKVAWDVYLDWMPDKDGAKALLAYKEAAEKAEAEVERLKAAIEEAMWQIRGPVDDRKSWVALHRAYLGKPAEGYENPNASPAAPSGVSPSPPQAPWCGKCGTFGHFDADHAARKERSP